MATKESSIEKQVEEKEVIIELGSSEKDGLYTMDKSFYLKLREGPGVAIPAGKIARLSYSTAWTAFAAGRVTPIGIDGERTYESIKKFVYVNAEGEYEEINPGTKLLLDEIEAILHLKRRNVKPTFPLPLFDEKGGKK